MKYRAKDTTILMVDDDANNCILVESALRDIGFSGRMLCIEDGMELLDYLDHCAAGKVGASFPYPALILLDLNMPRKDGRQTLKEIKADPRFRRIPIVILTTSKYEEDIALAYDFGANSFVTKPSRFSALVDMLKSLTSYWLEYVELPLAT